MTPTALPSRSSCCADCARELSRHDLSSLVVLQCSCTGRSVIAVYMYLDSRHEWRRTSMAPPPWVHKIGPTGPSETMSKKLPRSRPLLDRRTR